MTTIDAFPLRTYEKLRYADTDRQGHVNNAVFAVMLETGRTELLYDATLDLLVGDASWVIARLALDFLGEVTWPGTVEIGTRVQRVGSSSVTLEQGLFQHGRHVARGETVIVQVDAATRRSTSLGPSAVATLTSLAGPVQG